MIIDIQDLELMNYSINSVNNLLILKYLFNNKYYFNYFNSLLLFQKVFLFYKKVFYMLKIGIYIKALTIIDIKYVKHQILTKFIS